MGGCKAEPSSIRYKIVFLRRTYYRVVALGSRRAPPYARSVTHELPRISNRVGSIAESATLKVDGKAKALQAAGRPVISYAAGEPDFATPEHIVEAALAAVRDPKNYRYTPAVGLPELREAVAAKTLRDSGLEVSPSQVIITNGGKQAVYQSFATLLDPGD